MTVDREHLRRLSQAELLAVINSEGAGRSEAVEAAREELASRGSELAASEEVPQSYSPSRYTDSVMLARAAQYLLGVSVVAHVVEAAYTLLRTSAFAQLSTVTPVSFHMSDWFLLIDVPTIVVFCCWWYRVAMNVRALKATQLIYSPAASVWAFFIPIVNVLRPARVAQELWKASDPLITFNDAAARRAMRNSSLITTWWVCFVLAGVVNSFELTVSGVKIVTVGKAEIAISYGLLVIAGVAVIRLISIIQTRQVGRATSNSQAIAAQR